MKRIENNQPYYTTLAQSHTFNLWYEMDVCECDDIMFSKTFLISVFLYNI